MKSEDLKTKKDWALYYYDQGWCIIPARGKIPAVKWQEYQTKRPTREQVVKWWDENPNYNIALVTGAVSGVVVVDIDGVEIPPGLPPTAVVETSPRRFHYYFKHPGFSIKNAVGELMPGVDFRGDEGIIILPPSVHYDKTTGKPDGTYTWKLLPKETGFADLPQWVIERLKVKKPIQEIAKGTTQGSRNADTTSYIGYLLYNQKDLDKWQPLWEMVKAWNQINVKPPQEEDVLLATFKGLLEKERESRGQKPPETPRNPISFEVLEQIVHKWLLINDKGLIKVLVGTVVANKLQADPVWLFIVAAPGGTKTELIRGLNKVEKIYSISDLTPQTFLSGEKNNKTGSLLLRLPFGTILTYKDFTTVLTMHRDKQQAIISQLREIFDGAYRKEFGTGETKDWEGKIGFIAGVTTVIDRHHEIYSVLGERFIQYRPTQPDEIALAKKAIGNSGGETTMREEIQNAMADYIAGIKIPEEKIEIPEWLIDRVAHLASFVVKARSGIIRESYSTREIEQIPDPELPTRLSKQLITLSVAFNLMSNGSFTEDDYALVYKIGLDSIPTKRRLAIETLVKAKEQLETSEVATAISYPTNTTRRILEDLHGLKLIERESLGKGHPDKWKIKNSTLENLKKAGLPVADDSFYKQAEDIFNSVPEMSEDPVAEPKQEELSLI